MRPVASRILTTVAADVNRATRRAWGPQALSRKKFGMKREIACALVLALLSSLTLDQALSQSAVYAVAKIKAEVSGIDDEIGAEEKKIKEQQGTGQALTAEMGKQFEAEMAKYKQEKDKQWLPYQAIIEKYNSSCGGQLMPEAAVAQCNAEAERIKSEVSPVAEGFGRDVGAKAKEVEARLTREYAGRVRELSNATVLSQARIKKLTNYKSDLWQNLTKLEAFLKVQCPDIYNLEEMKLKCGNVQFDGANAHLPECTTDRCREYDAMPRK